MADKRKKKPSRILRFFLRGLITLLPIVLTLVIFGLLLQMVRTYVTGPINSGIYWSLERNAIGWSALRAMGVDPYHEDFLDASLLPLSLRALSNVDDPRFDEALAEHRAKNESFFLRDFEDLGIRRKALDDAVRARVHPVVGLVLSFLLVVWLGWLVGGFVGRRVVHRLDRALHVIPVVRTVYPYSKQIVEFFFAEKKIDFETVVAIPYPSPHLWSVAFVTSTAPKTIREHTGKDLVSCFVPSSPLPLTGYTIFVEASRIIPLPITVDEALRITMSGGVLIPPQEQADKTLPEALNVPQARAVGDET